MLEKHDLHHEFPEYYDRIHELKINSSHFAHLFEEYHAINREILRIEEGVENTMDEYLEELKKKRLLINLLRAPCTYPRGKTAGYYGAENQKRRATLTSKTQTIMFPVARPRGIASLKTNSMR